MLHYFRNKNFKYSLNLKKMPPKKYYSYSFAHCRTQIPTGLILAVIGLVFFYFILKITSKFFGLKYRFNI